MEKPLLVLMKMMNKTREPEAYRIGWVPFIHTEIYLDSKPLIPRTETEYWVDKAIKEIKESGINEPRVLDMCSGSGAIGVAVLKEVSDAFVDFVELDEKHHATIRKNVEMNNLDATRTQIFGGDLFENITDQYDFILSNPPYLDPKLQDRIQPTVALYEPELALYGGIGGLELIDRILEKVGKYLTPRGVLYLEHEPEHVEHLAKHPLYQETYKDQFGRQRVSCFKH